MKILLPNGEKINLDENISLDDKRQLADRLTVEWMPSIIKGWHNNSVRYFLDSLANYLVWHKEPEQKGREDKEILSRKKLEKMSNFKKTSKTTNFSDLPKDEQEMLFGEVQSNE